MPSHFFIQRMVLLIVSGLLVSMLLAACAAAVPTPPLDRKTRVPVGLPPGSPVESFPSAQAARLSLAQSLGLPSDSVLVRQVEPVEWLDACLGLAQPDEICAQMVTPGYLVTLEAQLQTYYFRTDLSGDLIRQVPRDVDLPPAVLAARAYLFASLGLTADQTIDVVDVQPVDWPDGCLGIQVPGQMCTQAIVPGYRILFEYAGEQYELHTDQTGDQIREAGPGLAQPPVQEPSITWMDSPESESCQSVAVTPTGVSAGRCGNELAFLPWINEVRAAEFDELAAWYAPFKANTAAGFVTFLGQGSQVASPAEQRSMAAWARLIHLEQQAGQVDPTLGIVLTWHQSGGIAGVCQDLVIYESGWASAFTCKGDVQQAVSTKRLQTQELDLLYNWLDRLVRLDIERADPAAADGLSEHLILAGSGGEAPAPGEQDGLFLLAQTIYQSILP